MIFRLPKTKIKIKKPKKPSIVCVYPNIENYAVRQLEFFVAKHKNKNKRQLYKAEELDALAMDIFWVAQCILKTKEIVEFHSKLRQIVKTDMDERGSIRHSHLPIERHLEIVEKITDFYEFHLDRGGSVRDKRISFLIALRMKVKIVILFLKNRTK